MRLRLLQKFLELESSSAILLFVMALVALIWANSPLAFVHQQFISASLFWVNEGLMAIFFLLVGLELKREFAEGELFDLSQVMLPAVAALGGMLFPALIYCGVNAGNSETLAGWATPVATDIAFALGVLSLFGKRVPTTLKLFLMALAIFDDIGAIILIALFYSHGIDYLLLFQSAMLVIILFLFNRMRVKYLLPYLLVGAFLWLSLLHSGVHPTIAGILLAFMIPAGKNAKKSPLHRLEHILHPWVAYLIMPLFALVNAGFPMYGLSINHFIEPVTLGIALGLFVGKQIGVFGFSWLLIQFKWAKLPVKSSWFELYGVSILCGIGFTMSLFLGTLSFQNQNIYLAEVRLGVIIGSIMSGLFGALVLIMALARKQNSQE